MPAGVAREASRGASREKAKASCGCHKIDVLVFGQRGVGVTVHVTGVSLGMCFSGRPEPT